MGLLESRCTPGARAERARCWLAVGGIAVLAALPVGAARADASTRERLARVDERIAAQPSDPQPLWQRAELQRELGAFDAALADLDRAERLAPGAAPGAMLRARVHLDDGFALAAVAALAPLVATPGSPADAHRLHAEALLELGRPAQAAAAFSRAIDAQPAPSPSLYLARARAWLGADADRRERALVGLDEGMKRLGPIPALVREAIIIELAMEHFRHALERVAVATEAARRKETWLEWRGRILEQAGRIEEAREAYARARSELARAPAAQRSSRAMRTLDENLQQALGVRLAARTGHHD